jgi:hypothetical protein
MAKELAPGVRAHTLHGGETIIGVKPAESAAGRDRC